VGRFSSAQRETLERVGAKTPQRPKIIDGPDTLC
jgi:hypothetical protein